MSSKGFKLNQDQFNLQKIIVAAHNKVDAKNDKGPIKLMKRKNSTDQIMAAGPKEEFKVKKDAYDTI